MEAIEITQSEEDARTIRQNLNQYNDRFVQPDQREKLILVVRREDAILGGLLGGTYWNWLYVEVFWVDEKERNAGLGSCILARAEEIAVQKGCKNAHLKTQDFQSLEFYKRRGYVVFGELEDLPEGHTKYYLHMRLNQG